MKTYVYLFFILFGVFSLTSCLEDDCSEEVTYILQTPVTKTFTEVREASVAFDQARPLVNPGKMYFYQDYVFINERREGVHIIDNSNPMSPDNIGFITIEGNVDIAVRDHFLYADSYMDLLTLDISDIRNPDVTFRSEDVFQSHFSIWEENTFLAYYEEELITETVECGTSVDFGCPNCTIIDGDFDVAVPESGGDAASGTGGSFARFGIFSEYLYALDTWQMHVLNLRNPETPALQSSVQMQFGVETIFGADDHLFVGANNGLYIYDNSVHGKPSYVSEFSHATACDPVVVDGDYAYVTLRSGTPCEGFSNQLDVIDISTITRPQLVKSFPMQNPHGLAKKDDHLYLCEGEFGFKTFDASDPNVVGDQLIHHDKSFDAYDVIALSQSHVMVIGADGFYQFDISDPQNPVLLSVILVENAST